MGHLGRLRGRLGPSWVVLEAVLGLLGLSWGSLGSFFDRLGDILEASWAVLSNRKPEKAMRPKSSKHLKKHVDFCLFGLSWKSSWKLLGSPWRPLGDLLGRLGPSWDHRGPSWDHLGPSWRRLGAIFRLSWGPSWPSWRHLGGHLGPSWLSWRRVVLIFLCFFGFLGFPVGRWVGPKSIRKVFGRAK